MADIQNELNAIASAEYGSEVRDSISSAIQKLNTVAEDAIKKADAAENAASVFKAADAFTVHTDEETGEESVMVNTFEGATAQQDGKGGLVPQPHIGDQDRFLKGDGSWSDLGTANIPLFSVNNDGAVKAPTIVSEDYFLTAKNTWVRVVGVTGANSGGSISQSTNNSDELRYFQAVASADGSGIHLYWDFRSRYHKSRTGVYRPINEIQIWRTTGPYANKKSHPTSPIRTIPVTYKYAEGSEDHEYTKYDKSYYRYDFRHLDTAGKLALHNTDDDGIVDTDIEDNETYYYIMTESLLSYNEDDETIKDDDFVCTGYSGYYTYTARTSNHNRGDVKLGYWTQWKNTDDSKYLWNVANNKVKVTNLVTEFDYSTVDWATSSSDKILAMVKAAHNGDLDLADYWDDYDARKITLNTIAAADDVSTVASKEVYLILKKCDKKALQYTLEDGTIKTGKSSFLVCFCSVQANLDESIRKGSYDLFTVSSTANNDPNGSFYDTYWAGKKLRDWCNTALLTAIDDANIRNIFTPFGNYSYIVGDDNAPASSTKTNGGSVVYDYLTVPSPKELAGESLLTSSGFTNLISLERDNPDAIFGNIYSESYGFYGMVTRIYYAISNSLPGVYIPSTEGTSPDAFNASGPANVLKYDTPNGLAGNPRKFAVYGCI